MTTSPTERPKIRVLLVDDNATFLTSAAEFLERQTELVLIGAINTAEDALSRVELLKPDVILLDLEMPGVSGLEIIPQLRVRLPQAGIIALSLLSGVSCREAALEAGANEFVSKTRLVTDLLPVIRQVV